MVKGRVNVELDGIKAEVYKKTGDKGRLNKDNRN